MKYTATDGAEVKLSKAIVARYVIAGNGEASDKDLFRFMMMCRARRLNPLAGDAYMTCFKDRKTGGTNASVIVSKDYFVRTATKSDTFDGFKAGVVVAKHNGELLYREGSIVGANSETLVGGWAEVHVKGRAVPSRAEVSIAEYDQHRSLWNTKPATMIRKVALVQALREAYPGEFGGIYDGDEMPEPVAPAPDPEPEAIEVEPVEDDKPDHPQDDEPETIEFGGEAE